jgi:DivIVA domain-containing protein
MPLTPEDVSNKRFTAVRLREGYDMGEVDAFLDEVEAELVRLTRENSELRTKLEAVQADGTPGQAPSPVASDTAPADTASGAAPAADAPDGTMQEATVTSLDKPGVETLRVTTTAEASVAATRLLELATRSADELLEDARAQADGILASARTDAERVEQEARARSEQLDVETGQRREQLLTSLEADRTTLASEVESLRTFEREYRAELKDYFAKQLDALEHPLAHSERFGTGAVPTQSSASERTETAGPVSG